MVCGLKGVWREWGVSGTGLSGRCLVGKFDEWKKGVAGRVCGGKGVWWLRHYGGKGGVRKLG